MTASRVSRSRLGCLRELTRTATVTPLEHGARSRHDVEVTQGDGIEGARDRRRASWLQPAVPRQGRLAEPALAAPLQAAHDRTAGVQRQGCLATTTALGRAASRVLASASRSRDAAKEVGLGVWRIDDDARERPAGLPGHRHRGTGAHRRARTRPPSSAVRRRLSATTRAAPASRSTNTADGAPRLSASMPAAPLPANRSRKDPPSGLVGIHLQGCRTAPA